MRQKSGTGKAPAQQIIKDIRRVTRKQYGAEEKITARHASIGGFRRHGRAACRDAGKSRAITSLHPR